MKINEIINALSIEYMPIKKNIVNAQKEGREVTAEEENTYFEMTTALGIYRIIKSRFMEEVTKNKEMNDDLLKNGIITSHKEKLKTKDDNGNEIEVDVDVIDQSMNFRIDNIPEDIQMDILEKMAKAHKENIEKLIDPETKKAKPGYYNVLRKEKYELEIIEKYLPKEATKEDIMNYINEYYPNGIEKKSMGKVIGEVKKAFERADGKLISECVKSKIS